jgi:N-acetylglutamate synthase-like GNAT family acetyltransferase
VSTGLLVRRPVDTDWPQILTILEQANLHKIGGLEMPEFPLSDCFVAESGDELLGVCGYKILDEETAKSTLTAVLQEHRGSGVATGLKRVCIEFLRRQGIKRMYSNCDDPRTISWNVRNFGFRPTGVTIAKVEPYGRPDVDHWVNLVADL